MLDTWQDKTLAQMKDFLQSFDSVQAAFVVGSLANDLVQPDYWSDIDLIVVVSDQEISQFFPNTGWLEPIRSVFATSHSEDPPRFTLRVCFRDMRRVDFIFILASEFNNPKARNLHHFQKDYRVLFAKSPEVDQTLPQKFGVKSENQDPETQFLVMSNAFWFKGMLTVYKVVRNDLLIALHLALDLMRDCLVLKMMIRDRAKGTRHHRIGGVENMFVTQLMAQPSDYTAQGILVMVERYSQIYENLAVEWSPDYQVKREHLLDWTRQARGNLEQSDINIRS